MRHCVNPATICQSNLSRTLTLALPLVPSVEKKKETNMPQTYDAIVIGAGVMGASIAFHLAERGLQTAILERKVTASGATGHSSGLVRMHYDLAAESELTYKSYKLYFSNWKERVGGECGFQQTGFMQ